MRQLKKIIKMIRNKSGIALTETVVALVIISIVTACAISISMRSTSVYNDSLDRLEARLRADNALAAFQFSENRGDFRNALVASGFGINADNDFLASSYYFNSLKVSYENKTVSFLDRNDHAIYTIENYTDAELADLCDNYIEADSLYSYNKNEEFYNCNGDDIMKVKVDYQNGNVLFYKSAEDGWLNYYKGNFYGKKDDGDWFYYTIDSGWSSSWSDRKTAGNTPTVSYRKDADDAAKELGDPDNGDILDQVAYEKEFNRVITVARDEMFGKLEKLRKTFTKSYTSYEYTTSPFLSSIEILVDNDGSDIMNFLDGDEMVILTKKYTDHDEFLDILQALNQSGYKEYLENAYDFSARVEKLSTSTCSYYTFEYSKSIFSGSTSANIVFDDVAHTITVELSGTLISGTYYYDYNNTNILLSGRHFVQTNPNFNKDEYDTAVGRLKSTMNSEKITEFSVTVDHEKRQIYYNKNGTYYYSGSGNSWSSAAPNFNAEEFAEALANFRSVHTPLGYEDHYATAVDHDVLKVDIDYQNKRLDFSDEFGMISGNKPQTDEEYLSADNDFENYITEELPKINAFTQTGQTDTLEFDYKYNNYFVESSDVSKFTYTTYIKGTDWTKPIFFDRDNKSIYYKSGSNKYYWTKTDVTTESSWGRPSTTTTWAFDTSSKTSPKNDTSSSSEWWTTKTTTTTQKFSSDSDYNTAISQMISQEKPTAITVTCDFNTTNSTGTITASITSGRTPTTYYYQGSGTSWATAPRYGSGKTFSGRTAFDNAVEQFKANYTTNYNGSKFEDTYKVISSSNVMGSEEKSKHYTFNPLEFKNGSAIISFKAPAYTNENNQTVPETTKYFNANGDIVTGENQARLTTIAAYQSALANIVAKHNGVHTKLKAAFSTNVTKLTAAYKDCSFNFINEGGNEVYSYKYTDKDEFRSAQLNLYDIGMPLLYSGYDYYFDFFRYLGRINANDSTNSVSFVDDIGTSIISFPYESETARYNAAKKSLKDSGLYTYYPKESSIILVMQNKSLPIEMNESNRTISYKFKKSGLVGLFSSEKTYYYKGSANEWSENNPNISAAQWENAKKSLRDNYGKTVFFDSANRTISFSDGSYTQYYSGSGKTWSVSKKKFADDTSFAAAINTLKTAYSTSIIENDTDSFVYEKPFYNVNIHLGKNTDDPNQTLYTIEILDGAEILFREEYDNYNDYDNVVEEYKTTYLINNNEYTCQIGDYQVVINASFKTNNFSAVVQTSSGKSIYKLNYEKG